MGAEERVDLAVYYPASRDLDEWRARHARGDAPDAWPYGLNRLDGRIGRVAARSLPPDSAVHRIMRRIARATPAWMWRGAGPAGLVWDETNIDRLIATPGLSARYSGVVWVTDQLTGRDDSWRRVRRAALRRMDALWVLSSAQLDPLRDFIGPGGPPVHHVLFGVDADFYTPAPLPEKPLIVSVGGDRDRDAHTLFEALSTIRRERPDVDAVVQSTSTLTPPPGVTVAPYFTHRELRSLYARASMTVIATKPNLHVSGMTVGLETMATGRPVVITSSPGMEDYFGDTDAARTAPTGDAPQLARAALHLLSDRATLTAAAHAARAHVESRFTTEHLAARLAAIVSRPSGDQPIVDPQAPAEPTC